MYMYLTSLIHLIVLIIRQAGEVGGRAITLIISELQ